MNERSGEEWIQARYECVTSTDVVRIMGCEEQCSRKILLKSKFTKTDLMENASDFTKTLLAWGPNSKKLRYYSSEMCLLSKFGRKWLLFRECQ